MTRIQRRLARTLAFQTLFEIESRTERSIEDAVADRIDAMQEDTPVERSTAAFATRLVRGTLAERQAIDERIGRIAPAFPVEQLPMTDRVVLELAAYELFYDRKAPVGAVINEAVDMAKTYGGENSGRFVNGVLGTIAEELQNDGTTTQS